MTRANLLIAVVFVTIGFMLGASVVSVNAAGSTDREVERMARDVASIANGTCRNSRICP